MRDILSRGLWLLTLLGAVVGTLNALLSSPSGAPQQAVIAAQSCAFALLPYVFARAFDEMTRGRVAADRQAPRAETSEMQIGVG